MRGRITLIVCSFLLGILFYKSFVEAANIRRVAGFYDCVIKTPAEAVKKCEAKLEYTLFERILTYQPELWLYLRISLPEGDDDKGVAI